MSDGWLPIESAPRDGTIVLVWTAVSAGEIRGISRSAKGHADIARYSDGRSDYLGDWWDCCGGDYYSTWCQPTHWQPLPAPPSS